MKNEDTEKQEIKNKGTTQKNVCDSVSDNKEVSNIEVTEKVSSKTKKTKDEIVWIFDILGTVVALIAAIISLVTLFEMKIQRNNAYMPTIVFESVEVETDLSFSEQANIYDGIRFSTRNIGVGVAKKITYEVDSSNYIRWIELYNELNPDNQYLYEIDNNMLNISRDGILMGFSANYKNEKLFLLPNAEETYEFTLPGQYRMLLHEIYKYSNVGVIDIPDIEIKVSYFDVQGVLYEEIVHLSVETIFFMSNGEDEKSVTYQINMD